MSLAGFVKKKKGKKKPKKFTLDGVVEKKEKKKTPEIVAAPAEDETAAGWVDGDASLISSSSLSDKVAVVDTTSAKDKPKHEHYAKDLEAEKKKVDFHATRRAAHKSQEEKQEAPVAAPAVVPRWGAPRGVSTRINIADEASFPSLGGSAARVVVQPQTNLWNETEAENAELIHMALKAEKRTFVACLQFWGYEFGYFFKNGPEGLGYYKDPHPRDLEAPLEEPSVADEEAAAAAAAEAQEGETTNRFAKKKKKKKPKATATGDDAAAGEGDGEKKKKKKKKKPKAGTGDDAATGEGDGEKKKKKKKKKKKEGDAAVPGASVPAAAGDATAATGDAAAATGDVVGAADVAAE